MVRPATVIRNPLARGEPAGSGHSTPLIVEGIRHLAALHELRRLVHPVFSAARQTKPWSHTQGASDVQERLLCLIAAN